MDPTDQQDEQEPPERGETGVQGLPEERLSRIRAQNREAQARYRQRLKERVKELEDSVRATQARRSSAKLEQDRQRLIRFDARARITAAEEALHELRTKPPGQLTLSSPTFISPAANNTYSMDMHGLDAYMTSAGNIAGPPGAAAHSWSSARTSLGSIGVRAQQGTQGVAASGGGDERLQSGTSDSGGAGGAAGGSSSVLERMRSGETEHTHVSHIQSLTATSTAPAATAPVLKQKSPRLHGMRVAFRHPEQPLATTMATQQRGVLMPAVHAFAHRCLLNPSDALALSSMTTNVGGVGAIGSLRGLGGTGAGSTAEEGVAGVGSPSPRQGHPAEGQDAASSQQEADRSVMQRCWSAVQHCAEGIDAYLRQAAAGLGVPVEEVCWYVTTPFLISPGEPMTQSTSNCSVWCWYADALGAISYTLECCFLHATFQSMHEEGKVGGWAGEGGLAADGGFTSPAAPHTGPSGAGPALH